MTQELSQSFSEMSSVLSNAGEDFMSSGDEQGGDARPLTSKHRLLVWAAKHSIRRRPCNELLAIIRDFDPLEQRGLPKDFRTLYANYLQPVTSTLSNGSELAYFGIESMLNHDGVLNRIRGKLSPSEPVSMALHIDGLPLFKSSRTEFWPILGKVFDEIFIIAIHCGVGKPVSSSEYLAPVVNEIESLQQNGITIAGTEYVFWLSMFIADAPAKSFALNCIGHNGYNSCPKCWIRGAYFNAERVMCFVDVTAPLRTNHELRSMLDTMFHKDHSKPSELARLSDFDFIRQIPNDYMHSVCLGIVKAVLVRWLKTTKENQPFTYQLRRAINDLLKYISSYQYCPTIFARKPRSFEDLVHFKATEFRQLLLYLAVVIFHKKLPSFEMELIRRLFIVMRLLCAFTLDNSDEDKENSLECARENIVWLIQNTAAHYGDHVITYNWHALLHLPDDCRQFGSPDNFSAFCFESFLYQIKRYIRTGNKPLPQLVNRYSEYVFGRAHQENDETATLTTPRLIGPQSQDTYDFEHPSVTEQRRVMVSNCDLYAQCVYKGMPLRTDRVGNSFCRLASGMRMQIKHFFKYRATNKIYVQGKSYSNAFTVTHTYGLVS